MSFTVTPALQSVLEQDRELRITSSLVTPERKLEELDHRVDDGVAVTLLWNPDTNVTYLRVQDRKTGAPERMVKCLPGRERECFRHPYGTVA